MTDRQRAYWYAFLQLEPTLPERLDVLIPKMTAHLMNMLRDPESPPVEFSEVSIDWSAAPPPPVDYQAQVATAETEMAAKIVAAFGGLA